MKQICLGLTLVVIRTYSSSRHFLKQGIALTAAALLLAGCANAPPAEQNSDWARQLDRLQALDSWQVRGRVNVRYDDEAHTPKILWQQRDVEYHIRLWGTFNVGSTTIDGRPGQVTLEQDNQIRHANTPEDLILQQLGYELPVSYLEYWIKGIPAPGSDAELSFNELNLLSSLKQAGWTVTYTDPRQYDSITLPRRVELTRPQNDISLDFIGLNWTLGSDIN